MSKLSLPSAIIISMVMIFAFLTPFSNATFCCESQVVSTESTGSSYNPSIAVDSNGVVHVVWIYLIDNGDSGLDQDVFYKTYSDDIWSVAELISSESNQNSEYPSIAVDSSGMVYIIWHEESDYAGSGSDTDIFYKIFNGVTWSGTRAASTESTGNSYFPSIAISPDKAVHVAWFDGTPYEGSGWDLDIFYKMLDVAAPMAVAGPDQTVNEGGWSP